ncbi:MAG TPA: hypothetical protein VN905_08370 [Candidatus Binatia bacterium]|nr:hypothetical protein [Candidatus Binatia bacterium]
MDVHIGEVEAVVHDTAPPGEGDEPQIERIARRVIAILDDRSRRAQYAREDRAIHSGAVAEKERYG